VKELDFDRVNFLRYILAMSYREQLTQLLTTFDRGNYYFNGDIYYVIEHLTRPDVVVNSDRHEPSITADLLKIITPILWVVLLHPDIINSIKFRRAIIPLLQQLEHHSNTAVALLNYLHVRVAINNIVYSTFHHNFCASYHRVDPSIIARIALHQSDHGESEESTHLQHHSSRRNLLFDSGASGLIDPSSLSRINPSSPHGERTIQDTIFRQADNPDVSSNMSSLHQFNIADVLSRPIPDHRLSELHRLLVPPRYNASASSANPQEPSLSQQQQTPIVRRRYEQVSTDSAFTSFASPHNHHHDYRPGQQVLLQVQGHNTFDRYSDGPFTITRIHRYTNDVTVQVNSTTTRRVHVHHIVPYVEDLNPQESSHYID